MEPETSNIGYLDPPGVLWALCINSAGFGLDSSSSPGAPEALGCHTSGSSSAGGRRLRTTGSPLSQGLLDLAGSYVLLLEEAFVSSLFRAHTASSRSPPASPGLLRAAAFCCRLRRHVHHLSSEPSPSLAGRYVEVLIISLPSCSGKASTFTVLRGCI